MLVKFIKRFFVLIYVLIFLALIILDIWFQSTKTEFSVSSLIYWMILIGWLFSIWNFKLKSSFSLKTAFILFIVSAFIVTFGFTLIGELVMRISFIGWMIGGAHAFIEYNRNGDIKL